MVVSLSRAEYKSLPARLNSHRSNVPRLVLTLQLKDIGCPTTASTLAGCSTKKIATQGGKCAQNNVILSVHAL